MYALKLRAASLALAAGLAAASLPALADDDRDRDLIRWPTIVGIILPGNIVGAGTGAVTGGGLPWTVQRGSASLDPATGKLKFSVKGLVLAGGNSIGTAGAVNSVRGTLVCDVDGNTNGGNAVLVNTQATPLSIEGDAELEEVVSLPAACGASDIAFLVRIAGSGRWLANGAPLRRP